MMDLSDCTFFENSFSASSMSSCVKSAEMNRRPVMDLSHPLICDFNFQSVAEAGAASSRRNWTSSAKSFTKARSAMNSDSTNRTCRTTLTSLHECFITCGARSHLEKIMETQEDGLILLGHARHLLCSLRRHTEMRENAHDCSVAIRDIVAPTISFQ